MSRARTLLYAGITALALAACSEDDAFQLPAEGGSFIALSAAGGATTLPADGSSRLQITATIDRNSTRRMITFSTTEGTFAGSTASDKKSQTVTIDDLGRASVDLISATRAVTARIRAEVMSRAEVSATLEIEFTAVDVDGVLSFETAGGVSTLPADGASRLRLIARIASDSSERSVKFNTSDGELAGGTGSSTTERTVVADSADQALIELESSRDLVTAIVQAQLVNTPFVRTLAIQFVRAAPNLIEVTLSTAQINSEETLTATAKLIRSTGNPTPGTRVTFEAREGRGTGGGLVGFFPNGNVGFSSESDQAQATFDPDGFEGEATMVVRVEGTSVVGQAVFTVVAP